MRVVFPCPLCRADGRRTMLEADLDAASSVVNLEGLCAHAEGFGQVGRLTPEEERILITAALEAREPPTEPPDG